MKLLDETKKGCAFAVKDDIDPENEEFFKAVDLALNTNRSFYLSGKAGTGKTTFLKYLKKVSTKKMVVLAPTGVAAINAGGETIHSFFLVRPSIYYPGDPRLRTKCPEGSEDKSTIYDNFRYRPNKRQLLEELETIVIDEISMLRSDLLDVVDQLLRVFRKDNRPFGGVQMIFIGDSFQLPPVLNRNDRALYHQFYESEFFFDAKVMKSFEYERIELQKIYRQKEQQFVDLLNKVRVNKLDINDYNFLNSRVNRNFQSSSNDPYIILGTTNNYVDNINQIKLEELDTPRYSYEAKIIGDFPSNTYPTNETLELKVGAQVMFLRNDSNKRYYNGKIGKIVGLDEDVVRVEIDNTIVSLEKTVWKNVSYSWNRETKKIEETEIGSFEQFPLKLAWAITVHKSQGLTFDKVAAEIGNAFAPGQVYVALSRCTNLNGLVLLSPINHSAIRTDNRVLCFESLKMKTKFERVLSPLHRNAYRQETIAQN